MTVIGFEMKRARCVVGTLAVERQVELMSDIPRFERLHRAAIKFPEDKFHYIGIDDEGDTRASYEGEASPTSLLPP